MTIGERIEAARRAKGLSQGALAKLIGVKQPSISQLEAGVTSIPRGTTLARLAGALGVAPEWLMTGRGPMLSIAANTPEESELLMVFRSLDEAHRAVLLSTARALLATAEKPSAADPYPRAKTKR